MYFWNFNLQLSSFIDLILFHNRMSYFSFFFLEKFFLCVRLSLDCNTLVEHHLIHFHVPSTFGVGYFFFHRGLSNPSKVHAVIISQEN